MWGGKYRILFSLFLLIWIGSFPCPLEAATLTYYRYHIVQKGDTLFGIEDRYGVSSREIIKKNNLQSSTIYPGQKLIIPITVKGVYHRVNRYETLWRICRTYGVDIEEVIWLNRLSNADNIKVGQRIFIPGASRVRDIDIPEEIIIGRKPETPTEQGKIKRLEKRRFSIWPVKGKITGYEISEPGVDIFAPAGASIVAPAEGKVYFSGWLRGYGKTIIIEHQRLGIFTCYMHNFINLVKNEDSVNQGDIIGRIGSTGTAEQVKLHFEVRRANDGKPLDPGDYLPEKLPGKKLKLGSSE